MKLSKKYLKENIFYLFDEVEYYKINKGFVKATLNELSDLYKEAYKMGYWKAMNDVEDAHGKIFWKFRDEK